MMVVQDKILEDIEKYEGMVKNIQTFLNETLPGYPPLKVDGNLGPATLKRAQTYRKAYTIKTIPPIPTKAVKPNLKDWRLARALTVLRSQINNKWPNRSKESDGTIGDAKHASRSSDHNPWIKDDKGQPVVHAMDITHDPANGVNCNELVYYILHDLRIKYIIWNERIYNPSISLKWRKYDGSNPHTKHMHISLDDDQRSYDDETPWEIV